MENFIDILGWAGTCLILWAYYLISNKKLEATSREYQILNLIGGFGLGINVFYKQAWPALGLEIIWVTIAVFALVKEKGKG